MMLTRLAWRNLWRNRRRSLIILVSIIIGVLAMDYSGNFARGTMKQMVDNQLGTHIAHVQVHAKGFNDNKVVQNFMEFSDSLIANVRACPNVLSASRRTVIFGLLSSASSSAGVLLIGVVPQEEERVTTIHQLVREGRYLGTGANEIVISKRLAQTLDIGLGDRVVAMASALDGTVGSQMFRVVGLYESSSLSFDRMYVYVPLAMAQSVLHVGGRIAEVAVVAQSPDSARSVAHELRSELNASYEVLSFHDIMPSLLSQVETVDKLMIVFYLLIGAAMMFGIVNTMLMSVFERIREIGVLISIGMKSRQIIVMIELEALLLGLVGVVVGLGMSLILNGILSQTGVDLSVFSSGLAAFGMAAIVYPVMSAGALIQEALMVFAVCLAAAVYPAMRAVRLEPVRAIYHV